MREQGGRALIKIKNTHGLLVKLKTMSASEFQNKCLAVVSEVHATRAPVLITKRGKPFARLVPAGRPPKFIGRLKGIFTIVGEIESPLEPPDFWEHD